jgi:hypothetical protein
VQGNSARSQHQLDVRFPDPTPIAFSDIHFQHIELKQLISGNSLI